MLDGTYRMLDINSRIATRVRALRAAAELSLEALARRCNVSRSMLSLVERGETSPTAVILEKIAAGLGCTLASLFDDGDARRRSCLAQQRTHLLERPGIRIPAPKHFAPELSVADSHRRCDLPGWRPRVF